MNRSKWPIPIHIIVNDDIPDGEVLILSTPPNEVLQMMNGKSAEQQARLMVDLGYAGKIVGIAKAER